MKPILTTSQHAAALVSEGFSWPRVMAIIADAVQNTWRPAFAAWAMGLEPWKAIRAGLTVEAMLRSFVMIEVKHRIETSTWQAIDQQNASMLPSTDYAVDYVKGEDGLAKVTVGAAMRAAAIAPVMWWYGLPPKDAFYAGALTSALIESAVVQRVQQQLADDISGLYATK